MSGEWTSQSRQLPGGGGTQIELSRSGQSATFAEVVAAWQHDPDFCGFFNRLLADCPFQSFRWETPPVTTGTLQQPFEFVLLDSPELLQRPDASQFRTHLEHATASVVSFPNLGGDAILIVPTKLGEVIAYGHLGAFVRSAPQAQSNDFWKLLGEVAQARIGNRPMWMNTAGAGVPWLHVRLDDRPKYYHYAPYRKLVQ